MFWANIPETRCKFGLLIIKCSFLLSGLPQKDTQACPGVTMWEVDEGKNVRKMKP